MSSILIKNGRVVDYKQKLDKVTNVFIDNGKIVEITDETPKADKVIDATGKIVSPGFIDVHMHEDDYDEIADKIEKSMSVSALRMGVTTDIGGNCGDNAFEPDKYLDITDRDGAPVNIGLLAGHTYMRNMYGKHDKYKPISKEDIEKMAKTCAGFLESGCLGVSFGVKYVPGTTWEEIMALVDVCREYGVPVSSHVRQDVDGVFDAADELARMGREGQVKVQFSHIGSMGGYGQMKELLKKIEGYRNEGIDFMCDCYPYNAFSTGIGETTYDEGFLERYQSDYDSILLVSGKYAGQRCTEEIYRELRENAPHTATVGYFMKDEDVEMALMSSMVMIGSDGTRQEGKGHPRASGAFPKFIREYIKTGKISLLDGIGKMTSMAADVMGLENKGNLLSGSDADIVIFDLDKITDNATYENGQIPATGVAWVIIGGEVALENDQIVNDHLGKAIRRKA